MIASHDSASPDAQPMVEESKSSKPLTICTKSGLGFLENGVPFIQGWPNDRKPVDMAIAKSQTLVEAASWCQIASRFSRTTICSLGFQQLTWQRHTTEKPMIPKSYSHSQITKGFLNL